MEKIIARVKNIVDVMEIGTRNLGSQEMIDFYKSAWCKRELNQLHALLFALECIDEKLDLFITYSPLEVHGLQGVV
jgi:hypothetical protein